MTQALQKQGMQGNILPLIQEVRPGYAGGARLPWRLKMTLKIILSRLPLSYKFLSSMGIFRHGDITRQISNLHTSFTEPLDAYKAMRGHAPIYALELGPGDSIGHALCAAGAGMKGLWLIDAGDFASRDEDHYRAVYDYLRGQGYYNFSKAPEGFDRESVLAFSNSHYRTNGLEDMSDIPDDHLDLSFSQAVLEHVRRDHFQPYMNELYRVHKAGGISRHWVDLHDHLGGALNSFRFDPHFWESRAVRGAGFYTNRLTMKEMAKCAAKAGFRVEIQRILRWPELPTPRQVMHESFSGKTDEELNVCTFLMVLEKQ